MYKNRQADVIYLVLSGQIKKIQLLGREIETLETKNVNMNKLNEDLDKLFFLSTVFCIFFVCFTGLLCPIAFIKSTSM